MSQKKLKANYVSDSSWQAILLHKKFIFWNAFLLIAFLALYVIWPPIGEIGGLVLAIPLVVLFMIRHSIRGIFWKKFAAENEFIYEESAIKNSKHSLFFKNGLTKVVLHQVAGVKDGIYCRIFETRRDDKNYTVFGFDVTGSVPHIFLYANGNIFQDKGTGEELSIPGSFAENIRLIGPPEYEIEVLALFTPDVLGYLLQMSWLHNIELVDDKLYVYRKGFIQGNELLESELKEVMKLIDFLKPRIEKANFTQIGTASSFLHGGEEIT